MLIINTLTKTPKEVQVTSRDEVWSEGPRLFPGALLRVIELPRSQVRTDVVAGIVHIQEELCKTANLGDGFARLVNRFVSHEILFFLTVLAGDHTDVFVNQDHATGPVRSFPVRDAETHHDGIPAFAIPVRCIRNLRLARSESRARRKAKKQGRRHHQIE